MVTDLFVLAYQLEGRMNENAVATGVRHVPTKMRYVSHIIEACDNLVARTNVSSKFHVDS